MGRPSNAERAARKEAEQKQREATPLNLPPQLEEVGSPEREKNTHVELRDEARDSMMDELLARRGQKDEPKEEKKDEKPEDPQAEAKPEPKPDEQKPTSEAKPEEPKEEPQPVKLKQKVDGQEYEVTQAEIEEAGGERNWRIQKSTENRHARANEILAEANRVKAEILELKKQQPSQVPAAPIKSDQDFLKDKMDVIRFGTPEESAHAMLEVINRRATDPNQIVVQATTNFKHEMALTKFRTDYQDVVSHPVLGRLVPQMMQETLSPYVKNGTIDWSGLSNLDWNAEFSKVGNQIRDAVSGQSQPQPVAVAQSTPSSGTPDKEARKASIVNLPAASARAELPKEEKPETRDEVLTEMKRTRGLPVG